MSNNIALTISATDQEVVRALQRTADGVDKVVSRIQKLENQGAKATTQMSGGLSRATQQALGFAAAMTGVGSAVAAINMISQQLRKEYDNLISRQKTAADSQITYSNALTQTIRNAGGLFGGEETDQRVKKLSRDTWQDPTKVAIATGSVLSARGPTKKEEAVEALSSLKSVLEYFPEGDAQETALVAGSVIDLQKSLKISANKATGLLQSTAGLARVTDLKSMADNIGPAIIGAKGFGGTSQESASLVATISQFIQDPTGRETRNTSVNLGKHLERRMPEYGSTRERIEAIQADPDLYRRVIEGGRFGREKFGPLEIEAKSTTAVRNLLRGGTPEAEAYRSGIGKIGDESTWEPERQKMIDEMQKVRVNQVAAVDRALSSGIETMKINDKSAIGSIARDRYMEILKQGKVSEIGQKFALAEYELSSKFGTENQLQSLESGLRERASALREPQEKTIPTIYGAGVTKVPATQQSLDAAAELNRIADVVDSLAKVMQENVVATKKNSEVTAKNTESAKILPRKKSTPVSKRLSRESR